MPSGSDVRPRSLLQRDRRAPLCSAARSGRSSPQGLRILDRQRVSALVSTPRRLSRLSPSYSGHGRATLIHSCGHFPHEDLAGRPTACSGAGDRLALRHVVRPRPCTARLPGPAATAASVVHAGGIPDPCDRAVEVLALLADFEIIAQIEPIDASPHREPQPLVFRAPRTPHKAS
jgi:hypothetical protein